MQFKVEHKAYKKIFNFISQYKIVKLVNLVPDQLYLKLVYWLQTGEKLNFSNPVTYNEKLQWLKIYNRKELYTHMVNKFEVREYVAKIIGEEYLIPLIGVWDSFDEIDFNKLPEKFVLKCTHDSGGIAVCHSQKDFDVKKERKKFRRLLKNNYFNYLREWPYKNVVPQIVAEQLMTDGSGTDGQQLQDYKFFCFNGIPKLIMVVQDRFGTTKSNFYDMNFNIIDLRIGNPNFSEHIEKPINFDLMVEIAKRLSEGLKHIRVDLYNIRGKIYFGELTFFHWGGMSIIEPYEWNVKMGNWIKI